MTERERVIKDFEHEVKKANGEGWNFVNLLTDDGLKILAILKEQDASGWVSVKDGLPEQAGKRCLVCAKYGDNKNAVFIACIGYVSGEWETLDCLYMAKVRNPRDKKVHQAYVVTHWMPLPELPKEVSE